MLLYTLCSKEDNPIFNNYNYHNKKSFLALISALRIERLTIFKGNVVGEGFLPFFSKYYILDLDHHDLKNMLAM
jgi:hypothetical protein